MFTIEVNIDGAVHKLETLAEAAQDLEKPLNIFMAHLRQRALKRYKAQAFAPLAQSTLEKRAQRGLQIMEQKLTRDLRKAFGRARKARGSKGLLRKLIEGQAGRAMEDVLSENTRGVQNRKAVLAAFQRQHSNLKRGRFMEVASGQELTLKQQTSLGERTARQVKSTMQRPILGGLPRTLKWEVSGDTGMLMSKTREEWSEVHNEGGTAGHGAHEPERETITIETEDIEYFESVLKDHLLIAFNDGMHAPGY